MVLVTEQLSPSIFNKVVTVKQEGEAEVSFLLESYDIRESQPIGEERAPLSTRG